METRGKNPTPFTDFRRQAYLEGVDAANAGMSPDEAYRAAKLWYSASNYLRVAFKSGYDTRVQEQADEAEPSTRDETC